VFLREFRNAEPDIAAQIRVSSAIYHLASAVERRRRLQQSRNEFAEGFRQQQQARNFLRFPMYDYQVDGMLHLAFGGRAMLADELGLGKSVQAIAAAKILRQLWDVQRVLIACPAALKLRVSVTSLSNSCWSIIRGHPRLRCRSQRARRVTFNSAWS